MIASVLIHLVENELVSDLLYELDEPPTTFLTGY